MVINAQKQGKYVSLAIGLITLLYILRLNLLFLQSGFLRPLELFTARISMEIAFVIILVLIISKTRRVIENVNDSEFAITIRVAGIPLIVKKWQKKAISKIEIDQDSKRYYCLKIQFQDQSHLLISRYPNLLPVEQELSIVKTELGI